MSRANMICTANPWTKTKDTPEILGMPIDVLYLCKIEELKIEVREITKALTYKGNRLESAFVTKLEEQLDLHLVGGEGYGLSAEINNKLAELLKWAVEPVPQVTARVDMDLNEVMEGICVEIDSDGEEEEDVLVRVEDISI